MPNHDRFECQTAIDSDAILQQLFQFEPREVRRIFAGEYEIRYELNDQTIYVLRLWHTRENR